MQPDGNRVGRPRRHGQPPGPGPHPLGEGPVDRAPGVELQGGEEGVAGGQTPIGGPGRDGQRHPQGHHRQHEEDHADPGHAQRRRLRPRPRAEPPDDDEQQGDAGHDRRQELGRRHPPRQPQPPANGSKQRQHHDSRLAGRLIRRTVRATAAIASTNHDHSETTQNRTPPSSTRASTSIGSTGPNGPKPGSTGRAHVEEGADGPRTGAGLPIPVVAGARAMAGRSRAITSPFGPTKPGAARRPSR